MKDLDDSTRIPPNFASDPRIKQVSEMFFRDGKDSKEIATALNVKERGVIRVLHALRNEQRTAAAAGTEIARP